MTDEQHTEHAAHEHGEIHMPPNSWVPISLALSMALTFVGLLIHPVVWIVGLVLVIATLVQWFRAARSEYLELPD